MNKIVSAEEYVELFRSSVTEETWRGEISPNMSRYGLTPDCDLGGMYQRDLSFAAQLYYGRCEYRGELGDVDIDDCPVTLLGEPVRMTEDEFDELEVSGWWRPAMTYEEFQTCFILRLEMNYGEFYERLASGVLVLDAAKQEGETHRHCFWILPITPAQLVEIWELRPWEHPR